MRIFSFAVLVLGLIAGGAAAGEKHADPELLETGTSSLLYMSDAVYYPADGDRAVVWVPGFIFNKESWAQQAKALQEKGVASLAISGKTEEHVREALREARRRGHSDIILVGGSSGAAAVLNTMERVVATDFVTGVVTLSAVRGNPLDSRSVRKLFIVSEDEKSFSKVQALHQGSAEPKELLTVPGSAHAQFLFFGPDKDMVSAKLFDFLTK